MKLYDDSMQFFPKNYAMADVIIDKVLFKYKEKMIQKSLSEVHTTTKRSCDDITANLKQQIEICTKDFENLKSKFCPLS